MFCIEQISQLRDRQAEFESTNAHLVVIGSGSVLQAAELRTRLHSPHVFLVDPERTSFKAAGMRKDFLSTVNARTVPAIFRALKGGHRQRKIQGDAFQQGGVLVIRPDELVALKFVSKFGGDHCDVNDIFAALSAA